MKASWSTRATWHSTELSSTEQFVLAETNQGWQLKGDVSIPIRGVASRIGYSIDTDQDWSTRRATVDIRRGQEEQTIRIESGGGRWAVNGNLREDLAGCIDIDLGWTPATNTLPIRRLNLEVGERRMISAAWLRFPELAFGRSEQQYTRLGDRRWHYRSGAFEALLETSSEGLVTRYGDGIWTAESVED